MFQDTVNHPCNGFYLGLGANILLNSHTPMAKYTTDRIINAANSKVTFLNPKPRESTLFNATTAWVWGRKSKSRKVWLAIVKRLTLTGGKTDPEKNSSRTSGKLTKMAARVEVFEKQAVISPTPITEKLVMTHTKIATHNGP